MKRPHVWTLDEIRSLPEFGSGMGWFYALIRDDGKLRVCEVLPGLGYTDPWPLWNPRSWWWVVRDVLKFRPPPSALREAED